MVASNALDEWKMEPLQGIGVGVDDYPQGWLSAAAANPWAIGWNPFGGHSFPHVSGQKYCHTDESKKADEVASTESSAAVPNSSVIAENRLTMPRCLLMAPLGDPVEPDVKMQ